MRVRFEAPARHEFDQAKAWYAAIEPVLGRRFSDEVHAVMQRIVRRPTMFAVEYGDIHKCVLSKFPYTLRYALRGDVIVVVAISHHHRAPEYWRNPAKSE